MDMDMGLEMELVCNLTLKYVKELKHQRGGEAQNLYDLMKKVTVIALMNGLLHKNLTKCCTQESFGRSGLVSSHKMYVFYTPIPV